jgi:hypothetical protein
VDDGGHRPARPGVPARRLRRRDAGARLRFRLEPGADAPDFAVAVALETTVPAHVFVL